MSISLVKTFEDLPEDVVQTLLPQLNLEVLLALSSVNKKYRAKCWALINKLRIILGNNKSLLTNAYASAHADSLFGHIKVFALSFSRSRLHTAETSVQFEDTLDFFEKYSESFRSLKCLDLREVGYVEADARLSDLVGKRLTRIEHLDMCALTSQPSLYDNSNYCSSLGLLTNLRSLTMAVSGFTFRLEPLSSLTNLTSLVFYKKPQTREIYSFDRTDFEHIGMIRSLVHLGTYLAVIKGDDGFTPLSTLTNLQNLSVKVYSHQEYKDSLSALRWLTSLEMSTTNCEPLCPSTTRLTALQRLVLRDDKFSSNPEESDVEAAAELPALRHLELGVVELGVPVELSDLLYTQSNGLGQNTTRLGDGALGMLLHGDDTPPQQLEEEAVDDTLTFEVQVPFEALMTSEEGEPATAIGRMPGAVPSSIIGADTRRRSPIAAAAGQLRAEGPGPVWVGTSFPQTLSVGDRQLDSFDSLSAPLYLAGTALASEGSDVPREEASSTTPTTMTTTRAPSSTSRMENSQQQILPSVLQDVEREVQEALASWVTAPPDLQAVAAPRDINSSSFSSNLLFQLMDVWNRDCVSQVATTSRQGIQTQIDAAAGAPPASAATGPPGVDGEAGGSGGASSSVQDSVQCVASSSRSREGTRGEEDGTEGRPRKRQRQCSNGPACVGVADVDQEAIPSCPGGSPRRPDEGEHRENSAGVESTEAHGGAMEVDFPAERWGPHRIVLGPEPLAASSALLFRVLNSGTAAPPSTDASGLSRAAEEEGCLPFVGTIGEKRVMPGSSGRGHREASGDLGLDFEERTPGGAVDPRSVFCAELTTALRVASHAKGTRSEAARLRTKRTHRRRPSFVFCHEAWGDEVEEFEEVSTSSEEEAEHEEAGRRTGGEEERIGRDGMGVDMRQACMDMDMHFPESLSFDRHAAAKIAAERSGTTPMNSRQPAATLSLVSSTSVSPSLLASLPGSPGFYVGGSLFRTPEGGPSSAAGVPGPVSASSSPADTNTGEGEGGFDDDQGSRLVRQPALDLCDTAEALDAPAHLPGAGQDSVVSGLSLAAFAEGDVSVVQTDTAAVARRAAVADSRGAEGRGAAVAEPVNDLGGPEEVIDLSEDELFPFPSIRGAERSDAIASAVARIVAAAAEMPLSRTVFPQVESLVVLNLVAFHPLATVFPNLVSLEITFPPVSWCNTWKRPLPLLKKLSLSSVDGQVQWENLPSLEHLRIRRYSFMPHPSRLRCLTKLKLLEVCDMYEYNDSYDSILDTVPEAQNQNSENTLNPENSESLDLALGNPPPASHASIGTLTTAPPPASSFQGRAAADPLPTYLNIQQQDPFPYSHPAASGVGKPLFSAPSDAAEPLAPGPDAGESSGLLQYCHRAKTAEEPTYLLSTGDAVNVDENRRGAGTGTGATTTPLSLLEEDESAAPRPSFMERLLAAAEDTTSAVMQGGRDGTASGSGSGRNGTLGPLVPEMMVSGSPSGGGASNHLPLHRYTYRWGGWDELVVRAGLTHVEVRTWVYEEYAHEFMEMLDDPGPDRDVDDFSPAHEELADGAVPGLL